MARMGSTSKAIMGKIGFACKWIDTMDQCDGIKPTDDAKQYNLAATTVAWLKRQTAGAADDKMWELIRYNISATKRLVQRVGELDERLRMVRLGSDILPVYTEPTFGKFYRDPSVQAFCAQGFGEIGALARARGVRVSFHPGQFVVLASESDAIVERSIEEFEYHADMARWMGYGQQFQDFKINVHISGRKGAQGIKDVYGRLSNEARNCITIENEEVSHGLDTCITLGDTLPIVLDIHHHWVREGEYISPQDDRVKRVIDSWRGVRPTMHYSVSREDYLVGHSKDVEPDYLALLAAGYKKQKLRAHSDSYWNNEVNAWAAQFTDDFDIMCEAKAKNLASFEFANFVKSTQQTLA
jgi:UV DNA damage endonuclease